MNNKIYSLVPKGILYGTIILFSSIATFGQSPIIWSAATKVSANSYGNFHPRVVVDGSGNPLIIWGRSSDESVFFSKWNGTMFTTPIKLNPTGLTIATTSWMGPDIASKGDTVYVVMKRTPEASDTNHIYIVNSFNGGTTFSSPSRVDFIADSISRFPTVTTDAYGNPVIGFMKFNSAFSDSRWVVTKSSDYGNTFSTDVKASGWSGSGSLVCDCCPGSIACEGNNVAMLYRDNLSNIRDSWAGISTNGGTSFSNGINIDKNNWLIMACPSSGPDGVIIGDSLYSVFMNGAGGSSRVYRSASSISGSVAQASQLLTGSIPGLNQQNYPRIDKNGNAMAIVWKQNVSGAAQLPILFTNNISNGFPAKYDTVALNDITNADVALSNGNIFVVWQDDNSGTVKYRKGTFTPVNTSINEINESSLSVFPNPCNGQIKITSAKNIEEMKITNLFGQIIYRTKSNEKNLSLQIDNDGIYFITLTSDKQTITKKIIVLR